MGDVIIKPKCRIEGPDGPIYTTEIGGALVHGSKPMTPEGKATALEIMGAARKKMAEMIDRKNAERGRPLTDAEKLANLHREIYGI